MAARSRQCAPDLEEPVQKKKKTRQKFENVLKPENKGYEGIQLLLCHFRTNLNPTDVILLTAAVSSGPYDHFSNDNFVYLKALTA